MNTATTTSAKINDIHDDSIKFETYTTAAKVTISFRQQKKTVNNAEFFVPSSQNVVIMTVKNCPHYDADTLQPK